MCPKSLTLAETGELEFIRIIRGKTPQPSGALIRSVGDDCLVTAASVGDSLYTVDSFVDEVHFSRRFSGWVDIGHRCMAASVSDIAAMAGDPLWTLVSLSLPKDMLLDDAVALSTGLQKTADRYGCPVCGGETTSTPGPLTISITVIGTAPTGQAVMRNGARPGDQIYVTGTVGDAMAGLEAFTAAADGNEALKARFLRPEAQVRLAKELRDTVPVSAMIDLSDGIASDLGHICEESNVGAVIEADLIPLSQHYLEFMAASERDPVEFSLTAGEDFQLLFTLPPASKLETAMLSGGSITRIGTITGQSTGIKLMQSGRSLTTLTRKGYEHFKS